MNTADNLNMTRFLLFLMWATVDAFSPSCSFLYASNYVSFGTTASRISRRRNILFKLSVGVPPERESKGLLQILNDDVSELLLDRLNKKIYGESSHGVDDNKSKRRASQSATDGLSKFHRSILSTTSRRQRCVTGRYPLKITVEDNPTRKWLSSGYSSKPVATSQMLVNGTSVGKSLASYDRFQWLENDERDVLHEDHSLFSLELLAEIHIKKPGYVNVLPALNAGYSAKVEREESILRKNRYELKYDQKLDHGDNALQRSNTFDHDTLERLLEAEKERLWITGFSLTKTSGKVNFVEIESGTIGAMNKQTVSAIRWPNEVNSVPIQRYGNTTIDGVHSILEEDALLISDGFLVPGRDNGGLYVVSKPGHERREWRSCLAGGNGVDGLLSRLETKKNGQGGTMSMDDDGWFYHRAIWIDLTGDGRQSVLTARAKRPPLLKKTEKANSVKASVLDEDYVSKAQLVWLERPQPYSYDESTGTPLDKDGLVFDPFSPKHTPWKVHVLDDGPDVMFSVADMDTTDDTVEVFASQFFSRKLTLHSIRRGSKPEVVFRRVLDDRCGASFSSILANLDGSNNVMTRKVVDSGSTVPTLKPGDNFSHVLVTSHECTFAEDKDSPPTKQRKDNEDKESSLNIGSADDELSSIPSTLIDGGSLFSYRVPSGKDAWRTEPWIRSVIATGIRVKGQLGNMINPGAPGFCYTFYPKKENPNMPDGVFTRPLIAIAGDCAESAYILRPTEEQGTGEDQSSNYALMCEIECGATVGSIGIGYEDFCYAQQQRSYAKIYIPCYEKDKILVFALGNGEDDDMIDDW